MSYIKIKNLSKEYKTGDIITKALNDVNIEINKGELVVISGASGAGKTTLLNIIGGLDSPTIGEVIINGEDISKYNTKKRDNFIRNNIGFVFQFYNLIQNLTVLENIKLASEIVDKSFDDEEILEKLGIGDKINKMPSELSGGEQQRVSIARAIVKKSKILLCDEPIGALDYETGKSILEILQNVCKKEEIAVIIVTHNLAINNMANKIIYMKNGKIVEIKNNNKIDDAKDLIW